MHYISAVLFALSANMDNIAIGLSYSLKGVQIRFRNNLLIALLTSFGTAVSMAAGATLTALLPPKIASKLGCTILILMGLWFVVMSLHKKLRGGSVCEEWAEDMVAGVHQPGAQQETRLHSSGEGCIDERQKVIGPKESLFLALALMVNNLGFGAGAEIAGLPIFATSVCTLFCSMILLRAGTFIGEHFGNTLFGRCTDVISGVIIIALGVYEFFI